MIPFAANVVATLQRRLPMLLSDSDNPRKLPYPLGGSADRQTCITILCQCSCGWSNESNLESVLKKLHKVPCHIESAFVYSMRLSATSINKCPK